MTIKNMESIILLLFIFITVCLASFTWISWPFTIISEPKEAILSNLYFQDSSMKKNSTFSLYF
jgi:hypothetical protein